MSEIRTIEGVLERAKKRRRWHRAWRGLWRGMLIGASLWLTTLILYKLFPLPTVVVSLAAVGWVGSLMAGFVAGWARSSTLIEVARWVDQQQHLQERLSTALEVASSASSSGRWRDALLADAAGFARKLDPRQLLPFHVPSAARWSLLILVLAAGLGFVPEYRSAAYIQKELDSQNIRETGRQLAELTRRNFEQHPPALPPTRQAMESVEELGDRLSKVSLTRDEALRNIASVTDKLKDQAKELAQNPAFKRLERAARTPTGQSSPPNADLQKRIESLEKSLGKNASPTDALDKMKADLQKLQQAAAGLPAPDAAGAQAAREQLSQSLASLSKKSQELGLSLPSLAEAIKALEASNIDSLMKDLKFAEIDLDKLKAMAEAMQQLEKLAAQVGKELAEQLKNGQVEAAQKTLRRMIDQLKSADLKPDQLAQLLGEVSRAVDPAGDYGKVADLLKQAARQIGQSQRPGAAQSLADAAKELERLADQIGDGKDLMATLEALQHAQMCVGNCQGWNPSKGPPRAGKGGKPGRGVGTWAEEGGWMFYPEITETWDNSGVKRPDMDGRGITDRGEGQLSDKLAPTKIKGQMSEGGPMPSITLRGVSIKGQSKVGYQEAVTAAQTEAQSALSHEQVPRAYQGAVRDYFDDLKK